MATQTQPIKTFNVEQVKRFTSTALYHVSQSLYDMIITVLVIIYSRFFGTEDLV
jgi:hypothetical protein